MASIILDANVYLADWLVDDFSEHAKAILSTCHEGKITLHAPQLLYYEFTAVVRKSAARGRLRHLSPDKILNELLRIDVILHFDKDLMRRAFAIATELNLPTAYDSQYLALAERLDCDFWTTDQRLVAATSATNLRVKWLGDFVAKTDVNA